MKDKKKTLIILLSFISYLIIIFLKNYFFCDIFFGECFNEPYTGDLKIYNVHFKLNSINGYNGTLLDLIFILTNSWLSFKFFLIFFNLIFYSVIFFCCLILSQNKSLWKTMFIILVVIFYPFYEGYSSFGLQQGLGIIFMFISIFLVKKKYSFLWFLFALLSVLSHFIFLLFYIIFFFLKFFNVRSLIFLFLVSIFLYIFGITKFLSIIEIVNTLTNSTLFVNDTILDDIVIKIRFDFILFSSLPLFCYYVPQFKKVFNNDHLIKSLFKFHLLFSTAIYLFFSEYYYINRVLSISWLLYPFYFYILSRPLKFKIN